MAEGAWGTVQQGAHLLGLGSIQLSLDLLGAGREALQTGDAARGKGAQDIAHGLVATAHVDRNLGRALCRRHWLTECGCAAT